MPNQLFDSKHHGKFARYICSEIALTMCKVFEEFGADIYSLVGYASSIIVFHNGITTQVICFPAEARIYLADAAAIKVCSVATE